MQKDSSQARHPIRPRMAAALVLLLFLITEQAIEQLARGRAIEHEHVHVLIELSTLRARLEGVINAHLLLVHSLTAVISADPDIDQEEFSRIAKGVVDERHALRNIVGAPGMVVSLVYPLAGNEAVLGLDYQSHPAQSRAAMRAIQSSQSVLAGPIQLVQGGMGVVLRAPVFLPSTGTGGERRPWGIVAAVIELDTLYHEAGLPALLEELRLAIRGTDGTGAQGPVFFGHPSVFAEDAVTLDVEVPAGHWRLAAIPVGGWGASHMFPWLIRLTGLVLGLAAAFLTFQLVRSNQALALSESRYRHLFDFSPAPMLIYERASLRLLAVNEAFSRDYGYSREEALALVLTDLYPPEERGPITDLAADLTGLAHVGEWHHLRKDGTCMTIEARSHGLDYLGRQARVAVITDVTERKRVEDAVHRLNLELEEHVEARTAELAAVNKELETFTYMVSHDLKAPLRGIDGYSRLLLEDHQEQLDAEGRLFLRNVRQGVEQMGELIEDLLAYSRMERRSLQGISLDVGELVTRVLGERQEEISTRGAQVQVDLNGLEARADPDGLAMVLRNLLDNAFKFSRPGEPPVVTIGGETDEDRVRLRIQDQGIGFDMRFRNRIFEIFQRLERAEDYPGTGVGLAIVRKAMSRMGGRIWAESRRGQGTTFFLELPK